MNEDKQQQELQALRDWKESALKQLAKSDVLHAALRDHGEYLGRDVHEAAADLIRKLADLVKEASEIMQITYAGNFPAGIESFLVRADRAVSTTTRERRGVALIATERSRQVESEGWTPEHDAAHTRAEMVGAALCYASCAAQQVRGQAVATGNILAHWPWERSWWKPSDDPTRNLAKAGALIAAEIDRLLAVSPVPWAGSGSGAEEELTRGHTTGNPQSSRTASKDRG